MNRGANSFRMIRGLQNLPVILMKFKDYTGISCLNVLSKEILLSVVKWILAQNKVNKMPLHEAAKISNLNLIKLLLKWSSNYYFNKLKFTDDLEDLKLFIDEAISNQILCLDSFSLERFYRFSKEPAPISNFCYILVV